VPGYFHSRPWGAQVKVGAGRAIFIRGLELRVDAGLGSTFRALIPVKKGGCTTFNGTALCRLAAMAVES